MDIPPGGIAKLYSKEKLEEAKAKAIEHWRENLKAAKKGSPLDLSKASCAFCAMFLLKNDTCQGCPISEYSGHGYCYDTPYTELTALILQWERAGGLAPNGLVEIVEQEIEFLENLPIKNPYQTSGRPS